MGNAKVIEKIINNNIKGSKRTWFYTIYEGKRLSLMADAKNRFNRWYLDSINEQYDYIQICADAANDNDNNGVNAVEDVLIHTYVPLPRLTLLRYITYTYTKEKCKEREEKWMIQLDVYDHKKSIDKPVIRYPLFLKIKDDGSNSNYRLPSVNVFEQELYDDTFNYLYRIINRVLNFSSSFKST